MRDLCDIALNAAALRGATYCDVRVVESREQRIATRNGRVVTLEDHAGVGVGIRVIAGGAWGFSATTDLRTEAIAATAQRAVAIAQAAALVNRSPVQLTGETPASGEWDAPLVVDPFVVPLDERIDVLLRADAIARRNPAVRVCGGQMTFVRRTTHFASSEGAYTRQSATTSGAGIVVTTVSSSEMQVRSYPSSFGGQWVQGGWEAIEALDLPGHAEQIASEAEALLTADECPSGTRDLILDTRQLALQIHESCGHPAEADRLLQFEANFAGGTFLTREARGALTFGSPHVNIVADATQSGGLGTFGWDDEGVAAQRWNLVRDGVFDEFLTSRDTAAATGASSSRGCARASGFSRIPLVRMVNVSLQPGTAGTLEDLIADTEDGIYMETNASWSIDDRRYNFQFGCELAWEIRNGRRTRLLRNATYGGITPSFWRSCDAVCGPEEYRLWGVPNCGKGQPGQIMAMSHGSAPARFRNVAVGVGYAG